MNEVQQRSMKEIRAIIEAEDSRRADLLDAFANLTEDYQVELVLFSRSLIKRCEAEGRT